MSSAFSPGPCGAGLCRAASASGPSPPYLREEQMPSGAGGGRKGFPDNEEEEAIGGGSWVLCGSACLAKWGAREAGSSGDPNHTPHHLPEQTSESSGWFWRPARGPCPPPPLQVRCSLNPSYAGQGRGPQWPGLARRLPLPGPVPECWGQGRAGRAPLSPAARGLWLTGPRSSWLPQILSLDE